MDERIGAIKNQLYKTNENKDKGIMKLINIYCTGCNGQKQAKIKRKSVAMFVREEKLNS